MLEIAFIFITACTFIPPESCSVALREIAEQDQKERTSFLTMSKDEFLALRDSDLKRRNQIRELEKKNCLKTSEDFSNAALVFQHGDAPADFYQSFEWSKRAQNKSLTALSLDRFLVKSGKRQLFGSQASRKIDSECWCLEETEESFPDDVRIQYTGKKLSDQILWVKSLNGKNICPVFCGELAPAENGYLPGIW